MRDAMIVRRIVEGSKMLHPNAAPDLPTVAAGV